MFKLILFASMFLSQAAMAGTSMLCFNSGDMDGTYFLDITGFQDVLSGKAQAIKRNLGFKGFRSFVEPIADVTCTKPNPYLDGPKAVLACRSGMVSDYGKYEPVYEAIINQGEYGLEMNVTGPGISSTSRVFCQLKSQ